VSARHKARKRALDILFESAIRKSDALGILSEKESDPDVVLNEYTPVLVRGVCENLVGIDDVIAQFSRGWQIERMPPVDLCILRLGVYELLCQPELPENVAISEAVELATELSTDESPSFVNGVLAQVAQERPSLS
jgi:N utilization substance protein B